MDRGITESVSLISTGNAPAEHQATPDKWLANYNFGEGCWESPERRGNLRGYIQYRKTLPNECQ